MDSIYRPVIDSMTWSYSRLKLFETCQYAWYLRYLFGVKDQPNFYASYGSFVHHLIEKYYRDEISHQDLPIEFLMGFSYAIEGRYPRQEIVDKYIEAGHRYFREFSPMPYDMISIEERVEFRVGDNKFVGRIDFVGRDKDELAIVDHKSRDLKPRSKRKKPTQKDAELDDYLRQLYLYSIGVQEKYGELPSELCFNCFKSGIFIKEKFDQTAFNDAKRWATKTIDQIRNTDDFYPTVDWYYCTNLCGVKDECCYYEITREAERHRHS